MPTFDLTAPDGKTYSVDGPEGSTPEQAFSILQNHLKSAPPPDQYQQAALAEDKAIGGADAGFTRRLTHGATLGADSTIMAGLLTPLEMIRRGTLNPAEGYNYAKAREDLIMNKSRENTGALGTAAEILGGGVSGAGLANGGLTAGRLLAPEAGLLARSAASAADAGALGGFSGAMEGNGLNERATNAAKGLSAGAVLGGAAPGAFSILGGMASPILSNIRARANPRAFAESQVARGIHESSFNPDEISLRTVQAANEGQPQFTMADAMGNAGQEMLGTAARGPGAARTAIVDALEGRQAGQGRRVAGALAEGFDSPQTATQTEARLTGARDTAANAEYGSARNNAGSVDVGGTISHIDRTLGPGADQMLANPGSAATNDSAEAILQTFRNRLARTNPNDFASIQRIRGDMADAAQSAAQGGHGNKSRLIRGAVGQLDTAMEAASPGFRQANQNFAQASRNIDAIDQGRTAAMRGRTEDTIPAFQALPPGGQQAFRAGYVDPLIAQTQGAAFGANKARPLINDAFQAEAGAMAPGNDMMQRRLAREQTMFETRNTALGGASTAKNLAHDSAMGVSPEVVGAIRNLVTGNFGGALHSAIAAGKNGLTGNTAEVRQHIANILLQNGQNISPANLRRMVNETMTRINTINAITGNVGRGAAGGLAVAVPGTQRRQ